MHHNISLCFDLCTDSIVMAYANNPSLLMEFLTQPGPQCENKKSTLQVSGYTKQTKPTQKTHGLITRISGKGQEINAPQIKSKLQNRTQLFASAPLQSLQENDTETKEDTTCRLVLCFMIEADFQNWYVSIFHYHWVAIYA